MPAVTVQGAVTGARGLQVDNVVITATDITCTDETPCIGDLNDDGVVDLFDLIILINEWGPCIDPANCTADLDGDGVVDVFDQIALINAWGSCPE